jgi:protein-S-isoprenylcysteine O-methyltransferase Ste14
MPSYAYAILGIGWLLWVAPFFLIKRRHVKPDKRDPRARWGIVLQGLGYSLLWQGAFWQRALSGWRVGASLCLLVAASLLSWSGAHALGKQWRFDAGINADHELITIGPYRLLRHPIYASMLSLLLGTGLLITPWWRLLLSTLVFIVGTEVRVSIEDGLLAQRFGDRFREYQRTASAYIPFLR